MTKTICEKVFTETEEGVDLEINHLIVGCISSKNNNFNLDEEGNLTVRTITATEQDLSGGGTSGPEMSEILNMVYPIDSIYMSMNSINPSTLFGGTWEAWGTGRVPVGVNINDQDFNTVNKTGGTKQHTLTTAEIPSIRIRNNHPWGTAGSTAWRFQVTNANGTEGSNDYSVPPLGGLPHNNLQPYITCFMWRRIA